MFIYLFLTILVREEITPGGTSLTRMEHLNRKNKKEKWDFRRWVRVNGTCGFRSKMNENLRREEIFSPQKS